MLHSSTSETTNHDTADTNYKYALQSTFHGKSAVIMYSESANVELYLFLVLFFFVLKIDISDIKITFPIRVITFQLFLCKIIR